MEKHCQTCSKLSSIFNSFRLWLRKSLFGCRGIHAESDRTRYRSARVAFLAKHAPDCCCEPHKASKYSPRPVDSNELLTRFAISPRHKANANGAVKPSIFSQVTTNGCSVQRESIADDDEIVSFVKRSVNTDELGWLGVLEGRCDQLRRINLMRQPGHQSVCVYDTGERLNPSHAELFHSRESLAPEDVVELRGQLMAIFNDGKLVAPSQYRNGKVLARL